MRPRASVVLFVALSLLTLPTTAGGAPQGSAVPGDVIVDPDNPRGPVFTDLDGGTLTGPSDAAPEDVVLGFVEQHQRDLGLTAREVASLVVDRVLPLPNGDGHQVLLGQEIDGIAVHQAALVAAVDADGRLVMLGGRTGTTRTSGRAQLTAGQAIGRSAEHGGAGTRAAPRRSGTRERGRHQYDNPYAEDVAKPTPVSAELVWHQRPDGSLRLAWLTDVEVSAQSWNESVIDAATGAVLDHESRYAHAAPEGRVFTGQHPDANPSRTIRPFSGLDGDWVNGTTTSGNNVDAYLDRTNNNTNDEYQPSNANAHFNYAFTDAYRNLATVDDADFTNIPDATWQAAIDADLDAIITQLFYYTNDMHDWLYGFGFDEASGNFQIDNFGRGGAGGDPVLAEAQDGFDFGCQQTAADPDDPAIPVRCVNNANFGTPPDGASPRMQMYLFGRFASLPCRGDFGTMCGNRPYRDGSLDGDVIAHEYGHGVSNRLVPDALSGATNQAGSLGEGWSDAISMFRWNDAIVGEYVTGNTTRGIRNFAYDVHPWTYGDYSTTVTSPHRNGEIWAATMYDMRTRVGIPIATQRMLDGMRFTPSGPSPTFLDARTGILAAETLAGNGNRCAIWAAFALRGMGVDAESNGLHAVPTEDFTAPTNCLPVADAGGPYTTAEGTNVTVSAAGSDSGSHASAGAVVSYDWDLNNNGQYTDATGVQATFDRVGIDGVRTIGLRVTDAWGLTSTTTTTVTITNVLPTVTIDPIAAIDEFGTATISGTVSDPGWLEPLTATIDLDDGAGAQPLTGVLENVRPDATLSFTVQKQYGDDGDFQVQVCGRDTVGGAPNATVVCQTATAAVANIDPTVTIDDTAAEQYGGKTAFVLKLGDQLTVPVNATDPGSDDLTFVWDWADGTTPDEQTDLVNPPNLDPPKSPTVQPRDVTRSQAHTYTDACLYEITTTVTDDDGGVGTSTAAVVVTGDASRARGHGWWHAQYRPQRPNDFSDATLQCYLDIAVFFSLVFDDPLDRQEATRILRAPAKAPEDVQFDEKVLAAWLNFADGAFAFDTAVDTNGDGTLDSTFAEALLTAETVRIDPTATADEIRAQRDIIQRIIERDG